MTEDELMMHSYLVDKIDNAKFVFIDNATENFKKIARNTFDIDGVVYLDGKPGVKPHSNDILLTGRSYEECNETSAMLAKFGINNHVLYNPLTFDEKTRKTSGAHKGIMLKKLLDGGWNIQMHFEDDPIQIEEIKSYVGDRITVVHVNTNGLIELENVKHDMPE